MVINNRQATCRLLPISSGPARRGSFLSIKQKQKPQSSNDLEVYTVCGCVAAVIRHSKCYLVFGLTYSLVSNYTHTYIANIYRYFRYVETSLSGCCTQVVCWCHTICYLLMSFKVENKILHTHITTVRVFPPLTSYADIFK